MRRICLTAYAVSAELSAEKGPFPAFDRDRYLAGAFVRRLPATLRDRIASCGMRNSHLTVIAPAGTISLLAGNASSGLEPIFEFDGERRVLDRDGQPVDFAVTDRAVRLWRDLRPAQPLPDAFVSATAIAPEEHLLMQAALQPWVDGAISKTISLPGDFPRERYAALYERAHALGLKGCTTYRAGTARGQVIGPVDVERCCTVT
jgi:ribonucleoside-diphosphate reductase alpha chain